MAEPGLAAWMVSDSISAELQHRLPRQRKTQRGKLALLVATMLDVRSANLMDLTAGLPLEADRTGPLDNAQRYMRYQWITVFWAVRWPSATRSWNRSRARSWSRRSPRASRSS